MEHVSKIDRRTTKHGARFRITVPEDRQRNIIQRLERQSKQTHWRIRQNYRHRRPDQPRPTAPPPPLSRQILAVNVANISNKRPAIRHIVRNTRLWAISETCITSSNSALLSLDSMSSSIQPLDLDAEESPSVSHRALVAMNMDILEPPPTTVAERRLLVFGKPSTELFQFDNNHPVLIFGDWNTDPAAPSAHCPLVGSWSDCHAVLWITDHQTQHSPWSTSLRQSTTLCVMHQPAHFLTSPRVDRQTAVADHFVIRTSIRAEAQGQPPVLVLQPYPAITVSKQPIDCYIQLLGCASRRCIGRHDTDTDIHQLTSQFLESANAVADNLSLRLSPPATRSNRRLLSGATKRAILASNTARQAFIAAATHTNPDPVQCNTLRDEWSRLKAAATQLERVDGRKQWVKHADNLDRAVSDGRTDLVFSAARAMSGNSSRSAAVTPLYNSNGIVQYDPTSILRVMQGHYGSLAADTTGHSLDLQYWHDRQPIQVSRIHQPSETVTFSTRISRGIRLLQPFCR
ncbi:hypothetical protein BASA83_000633 [Batrachochytrium salamandrivorans]|nr:hypothetical protein BASA83_000633 [Batrachochytrium salamandrivorans]